MKNKVEKIIEILEKSVEYADKTNSDVVSIRFTRNLAQISIETLKTFILDYSNLEENNKSIKNKLHKAISENKVKSIQFRQKNEVQNSMIFNQIACLLENILRGLDNV